MKARKILSMIMALAMVISMMSVGVYAADEATVFEVSTDEALASALTSAKDGDTVKLAAGTYTGGISVGRDITLEGTLGENGERLTEIKGGNVAIYISKGTVKNLKITDAFRGFYGEPCSTVTFDNLHLSGVTYGIHLVAYSNDPIWTIKNCYIDASWANSFGTYKCDGATIKIINNEFASTSPYYADSGSPLVNTFSSKTIISDNIFGENTKVLVREDAKDGTEIGNNYYEDGFENALHTSCANGVQIETYYTTPEMTETKVAPRGLLNSCRVNVDNPDRTFITTELSSVYAENSIKLEIYDSNDTLLASTDATGKVFDEITFPIGSLSVFTGINSTDDYWATEWEDGKLRSDFVPAKAILYVDGLKFSECDVVMKGATSNADIVWSEVSGVPAAVKINDTPYATLEAAIAALEDGDTLKIASGRYDGFDVLVDNVTITGMTEDAEITINSIPGNAFIGINAEGVSIEGLKFIIPADCGRTGDYLDGFDAVIGYWSNNFNAGSNVTTGYDVKDCSFVNEGSDIGVAMFNFSSFEIVGNTFENFNVGIHTMSDGSAMGTVKIEGNTFTKVNEPVNVYWGKKGEDNNSIAITGNTFASAKDADEIKITVHDYASKVTGNTGIDVIDMSGNTFSAATEVVLVDAAADVSVSVEETLTDVENVVLDNKYNAVARIGNNTYYASLDAALDAAEEGAEIDLLGNEVVLDATLKADKNITIKNGTLDATDVVFEDGFGISVGVGEAITFENVDFVLDNAKAYQGFFYNEGTVTFNGGSVVANGTDAPAIFHGGENKPAGTFVINGTEITLSALVNGGEGGRGFLYPMLDIDDATITMTDLTDNAMRSVAGTVDNSIITVDGAEYGIKNKDFDGVLTVTDSKITITNTKNDDNNVGIYLDTVDGLVADENSVINASIYVAPAEENGEPTIYYALVFAESDLPSVNEIAGTVIDLSEYVPTRDGYTFSGWYADAELNDEIDTVTLDENTTVYAAWTKNRTSNTNGTSGGLQAGGDTSNKGADDLGQKDDADDKTPVTPVTPAAHPFADVNSDHWYNAAVEYVYKNGLMNGTAEDKFSPNATLTRSMLVTVLYRAEGSPATNKSIPFGDVDMGAYYADAVIWAKQNGIVNGVTENDFAPNANITREQIAAIMHRYASYKGYNVAVAAELTGFADAKNVSAYAVDAMKYAVGAGIINGKTATTVNPAEFATRAELATILMRFIENNK